MRSLGPEDKDSKDVSNDDDDCFQYVYDHEGKGR